MTTATEERYQFVLSLYLIRKQYSQMGLFQPDFIWVTFRSMMPSKYNRTDDDIQRAVDEWCDDSIAATENYGKISKWNTSLVTNMENLFNGSCYGGNIKRRNFNDDISKWDVSKVRTMYGIFNGAESFNGNIFKWNVSNVINMRYMFNSASSFNGDISKWDVSQVADMNSIFRGASSFNGDISRWDVSNVTDIGFMFYGASRFQCDISNWKLKKVKLVRGAFTCCYIEKNNIPLEFR
jgi:surface protein